ncbi:MAG: DUF1700 domain-containing protein [Bacilli bacterium]|nr:DUF1700 domain-containing protein [Bacilli bacterium]
MTKKKFLSELEERLSVLSDEEKQDIINEYKDIIEEKVRNGKTVGEAINDFGDIDELAKEILKAYKINPDYSQKSKDGEVLGKIESGIRKIANALAEITEQIISEVKSNNVTVEKVFEVVIKVFILLIALMVLKWPFYLIHGIGMSILEVGYQPVETILFIIWGTVVWTTYFILSVALFFIFIKKEMETHNNEVTKVIKKEKTIVKKEKTVVKTEVKEKNKAEAKDPEVVVEKETNIKPENSKKNNFIPNIFKVIIGICFLFPLVAINIGLFGAISVVIYLIIRGIEIYGILIIIIGLIFIFSNLYNIFYNIVVSKKKLYMFPFAIGMVLITFGGLMSFNYFINLNYYDHMPDIKLESKTDTYTRTFENELNIINYSSNNKIKLVADNSLEDNVVRVEAKYYNEYIRIGERLDRDHYRNESYLEFYPKTKWRLNKLINRFINDLEKNEVYNYKELFNIDVTIHANEKTLKLINVD